MKRQGEENAVIQHIEQQQEQQCLQSECIVAQIEKIQRLQNQLAAVQFKQQANGALSVGGSIPGWIPASISTGIIQESMEAMFKI